MALSAYCCFDSGMRQVPSSSATELPSGFIYRPEFVTAEEEQQLLGIFETLPFRAFTFRGYVGRRRIVEYGYSYDFSSRRATSIPFAPEFLEPFKMRAAEWAGIAPNQLAEVIITEYSAGAPIGWHRDVPQFGTVIGISLRSACRMRFKPYKAAGKVVSVILEPRSAYAISGPARWDYQHSIPPVQDLRYSITLRTLNKTAKAA
jgi:alkylated DNA repair dioxygenase AlkB